MGGVDGQSPTEGEGLLIGTAKGQGTKDRGGGSARMRKPKFKIHGHQTAECEQARIVARVLGPSPTPRESAFSQDSKQAGFLAELAKMTSYAPSLKVFLLWTIPNKSKANRIVS